jgi:xylulokinase
MASGTYFYDIHDQVWAEGILKRFGIPDDKLPELRWGGSAVGTILPEVAREIGLSEGTVIATGGQDQKCAALGAGIDDELITISLGTATAITQLRDQPVVNEERRIACCSYLFPRTWVLEGVIGTSCASLNWLRDTFYSDRSYAELDEMAEACAPGENDLFFYPFLTGAASPYMKGDARGFLYGIGLSTSGAQMIRAVLEGVAYMIRKNLEVMNGSPNIDKTLRVFGGGAKSALWCKIIAEISRCRTETVFSPETASVGAAVLAGLGSGLFADPGEAREKIAVGATFEPDEKNTAAYRRCYERYLSILERMIDGGKG